MVESGRVRTSSLSLEQWFRAREPSTVVIEAGCHSGWISRSASRCGHNVLVANPRQLALIYAANDKSDYTDPEKLARVGRLDPKLLAPIRHRGERAQLDLALLRSRNVLVETRTRLVNHARSLVKGVGERLPACSTSAFCNKAADRVPEELREALQPVIEIIAELTRKIRGCDRAIESLAGRYPGIPKLQQVAGVGPLTAAAYVLTLADPTRFRKSRDVAPYLGLVPRQDASGARNPQLRISKAGNGYLRLLLVQSAHYVLGAFGPDSDLRRWGLKLAERGGKNGKKRAVVAVARKLAVLLHALWTKDAVYQPLRGAALESVKAVG